MDDVLKLIDKVMLEDYEPGCKYDDTCSYALRFRNADKPHYQRNDVCHARAYPDNYRRGPIRSVTTSIWHYNNETKDFVHWLLDKDVSPWRGLFGNMTIHRDDAKIYAVTIDDLDKTDVTSAYVLNFLIASRIPSEKTENLNLWNKARKHGLSGAEAMIVATHLYQNSDVLYVQQVNFGHYPFDITENSSVWYPEKRQGKFMNSVVRLENADPYPCTGKWKDGAKPNPINGIWKEFDRKPIKYFNQLVDAKNLKPEYNGRFVNVIRHDNLLALDVDLVRPPARAYDARPLTWDIIKETKNEWRV